MAHRAQSCLKLGGSCFAGAEPGGQQRDHFIVQLSTLDCFLHGTGLHVIESDAILGEQMHQQFIYLVGRLDVTVRRFDSLGTIFFLDLVGIAHGSAGEILIEINASVVDLLIEAPKRNLASGDVPFRHFAVALAHRQDVVTSILFELFPLLGVRVLGGTPQLVVLRPGHAEQAHKVAACFELRLIGADV